MPEGKPINRQWIFVLPDGNAAIDWGNGLAQCIFSGEFLHFEQDKLCHPIQDDELEILKRAGQVASFDDQVVYVYYLPELPHRTIE